MRRILCLLAAALALSAAPVFAQERMIAPDPTELAPGFRACMSEADTDMAMSDCYSAATQYWDAILNANFKKAMAACAQASDEKACRDTLREAQRQWMRYRDAMIPVLMPEDAGTLQRVEANAFVAEETKKQAGLLGREE